VALAAGVCDLREIVRDCIMEQKKTAYWTQKTHLFDADEFICSACGYSADKAYKNCPKCGAEMAESKYDPTWVDEAFMAEMILGD